MWEQLTPADLERAKNDLTLRRTAILARHEEELRALDSEQAGLETLERLIDAFVQQFKNQTTTEPSEPAGSEEEDTARSAAPDTPQDHTAAAELPVPVASTSFGSFLVRRLGS